MKYKSEQIDKLDLSEAHIERGEIDGRDLIMYITGAYAFAANPLNESGKDIALSEIKAVFKNFELRSAEAQSRKILIAKNNTVRDVKERKLYKSELEDFADRICTEGADIFSLTAKDGEITAELNFDCGAMEEGLFTVKILFGEISLEWEGFGEIRRKKKLTLKERANVLKNEVPAVFLALGKKETPRMAKIISAVAVGYALSPIDLVPDFIPVIGYLDDVIILPGLIYMAVRLIPEEVMAECRKEAAGLWERGKPKKWFYALPVIIIWLLIIMLIISLFIK